MALALTSETDFFAQLEKRGFEKTEISEDDLVVWRLYGESYIVPMPVHKECDHRLYCPFAIELFFKHVFGEKSNIETNQHSNASFNVVPIKNV